eukprot:GHVL01005933.1.p1 GENE.GHVL01005933.1~~GHVL01005933.1.p1  ORF type:complete len:263 (-),score=54.31 GHVL01005933.1:438-1226(-)
MISPYFKKQEQILDYINKLVKSENLIFSKNEYFSLRTVRDTIISSKLITELSLAIDTLIQQHERDDLNFLKIWKKMKNILINEESSNNGISIIRLLLFLSIHARKHEKIKNESSIILWRSLLCNPPYFWKHPNKELNYIEDVNDILQNIFSKKYEFFCKIENNIGPIFYRFSKNSQNLFIYGVTVLQCLSLVKRIESQFLIKCLKIIWELYAGLILSPNTIKTFSSEWNEHSLDYLKSDWFIGALPQASYVISELTFYGSKI